MLTLEMFLAWEYGPHKGYNGHPLFIYLFILFGYFCSRAEITKGD
jgi:hypothetical protein